MKFHPLRRLSPSLKNTLFLLVTGVLFTSLDPVRAIGDTIAFSSMGNIYTMNTDGTNLIELARGSTPSWSPDGTQIVFSFGLGRFRGDVSDVYIMDANGANRVNLTQGRHKNNGVPDWSPDGTKIAFDSNRDDNAEIYVMNADGKNSKNLTLHLDDDSWPRWSPDGRKIAFDSLQVAGGVLNHSDIFVMDVDGANRTNITQNPRAYNTTPSWSPDGERIAFARAIHDDITDSDIYVMNADGTGLVNLTQTPGVGEWHPSWKPTPFSVSSRDKLPTRWAEVKEIGH